MSGSPKYNTVRSSELRRQEAERKRLEREQRRREAERREAEAALAASRDRAVTRITLAIERGEELEAQSRVAGLGERAGQLVSTLRGLAEAARKAGDQPRVTAVLADAGRAEDDLLALRGELITRKRAEAGYRIEEVAAMLNDVPENVRIRYDSAGNDEVAELIGRAWRQLATDPQGSLTRANAAAQAVREHLATVAARQSAHDEQVREATRAVQATEGRLGLLDSDAQQVRISLPGSEEVHAEVVALRAALDRGDLARVLADGHAVWQRLNSVEASLDEAIDRISERRDLLTSIIAALPDAGFQVARNSYIESPDGAFGIRADSLGGEGLSVLVRAGADEQPQVLYTTDTMQDEMASGSGDQGCPNLIEIIQYLSEKASHDGFVPGTIRWDDDGDRPPPSRGARVRQPHARGAGS